MAVVPTTLIIDFYDSYTRNLLVLFSQLASQHGWDPRWEQRVVVVNVDNLTWDEFVSAILPHVACVVLGPGPGSPHKTADFSWPTRLIREFGHRLPIFGLCLGHQGVATAFGGSVVKAPAPRHGQVTQIQHSGCDLFEGIPATFGAVQFNSLVVAGARAGPGAASVPIELEVVAWAGPDDAESIMGLRHRSQPLYGVQFHPESIASSYGVRLLSNFLSIATAFHQMHDPARNVAAPLPAHVRNLSTSLPAKVYMNGIPKTAADWRWEMRTVELGDGGGRSTQEVFEGFVKGADALGDIWLDSARPTVSPQFSHLANPAFTWSLSRPDNILLTRTRASSSHPPSSSRPLASPTLFLDTLAAAQANLKRLTRLPTRGPSVPLGFVGYLSYEMKEVTLPHCTPATAPSTVAEFAFASTLLSFEHATGKWTASGLVRLVPWGGPADPAETATESSFGVEEAEWTAWLASVASYFDLPRAPAVKLSPSPSPLSFDSLLSDLCRSEYITAIVAARTSIIAGDAYELCLTTQFRATVPDATAADPYPLYAALRRSNPAPYSAYFRLPQSDIAILSSSPERFMRIDQTGEVEMKPIKGTVRRSSDPVEDDRRKLALEADEKERAENLMIVDLCRNDLLRFCQVDTVAVPRLMVVESYETVHQLVTSITGQLAPGVSPFEAIACAFPPGSMTGAPKLRSVQILEELERHVPRGVYAGAFGYVAVDGTTDFAVVIRTMLIRGSQLQLGGGGAITHLSKPAQEWEEALVKIEAVIGRD